MGKDNFHLRGGNDGPNQEIELMTMELKVENKRFYFNLKENQKGRFLKIAEVSGGRSTIIIPQSGWNDFRQMLDEFISTPSAGTPRRF